MANTYQSTGGSPFEAYIQGFSVFAIFIGCSLLTLVSMWMNFNAGVSFTQNAAGSLALGLLMIGTDTVKLFGLFVIGMAYRGGHYIHCLLATVMMLLLVALSLFAGSKFALDARLGAMAARADTQAEVTYDTTERDRLNRQLQNPTTHRSTAEIDAEITGLLQRRYGGQTVAAATQNCTDIGRIGQRTCARIAELRQERAAAERYAGMRQRRDALDSAARQARQAAPTRDVQAEQYAKEWGTTPETVVYYVTWLLAIAAEYASIFFLYFVRTYFPLFRCPDTNAEPAAVSAGADLDGLSGAAGNRYGANGISCGNPDCPHEHAEVNATPRSNSPERRANGFDRHF